MYNILYEFLRREKEKKKEEKGREMNVSHLNWLWSTPAKEDEVGRGQSDLYHVVHYFGHSFGQNSSVDRMIASGVWVVATWLCISWQITDEWVSREVERMGT